MRLRLTVDVPESAGHITTVGRLSQAAVDRRGITLTLPTGERVDVDLVYVSVVPKKGAST